MSATDRHHATMFARLGVAILGVVIVAWFGVLTRDSEALSQGLAAPQGGLPALIAELRTPSDFSGLARQLRDARLLSPDTAPELQLAGDYQIRGGRASLDEALRIAESVTRREPENLTAWIDVFSIQRYRFDLSGQRVALAHIRQLDPLSFGRR